MSHLIMAVAAAIVGWVVGYEQGSSAREALKARSRGLHRKHLTCIRNWRKDVDSKESSAWKST